MRLDDLNKTLLAYIFSNTLAAIYIISLRRIVSISLCSEYFRTEEVLSNISSVPLYLLYFTLYAI